jgi:hypothetical protein
MYSNHASNLPLETAEVLLAVTHITLPNCLKTAKIMTAALWMSGALLLLSIA